MFPRHNDCALTDAAIDVKVLMKSEVASINRCHLYLQVFYLSNIVSGNGRTVLQEAIDGKALRHRLKLDHRPEIGKSGLWLCAKYEFPLKHLLY